MRKFVYLLTFILLVCTVHFSVQAQTPDDIREKPKLKIKDLEVRKYFKDTEGTFLLRDLKTGKMFIYNKERANQRFTPESTFKIPNALIGLQTKTVRDEYDVKRWDGMNREFESWNRDHTLGSAMRESAIWYYQAMARDIGEQRMQEYVDEINYGNMNISGGVDQFWLDSSLEITAEEQLLFMEKLYKEELNFDSNVMKTVKRMMIQDERGHYTLYGKTGTRLSDLELGWYVGFVKNDKRDFVFVTNIEGSGSQAKSITIDILKKYRIIE
jgi:beta-lactamase class D